MCQANCQGIGIPFASSYINNKHIRATKNKNVSDWNSVITRCILFRFNNIYFNIIEFQA